MKKISILSLVLILLLSFLVRIWNITSVPPALYWDEMDIGYQSYSILKTGRDYFGNLPGLVVRSFADFRAPLLIYTTIPSVALLGLNIFSVRLPAAIFGTISVFLIYILSKILFKSERISLTAALLAGFAPWSIQYSRMAFELTLLFSLFLGGIICFLKGVKSSKWFIVSGISLSLSLIAYNTAKLFVPLILITLTAIFIRKKNIDKNFWIGLGIFGFLLVACLYMSVYKGGGMRFSEIAIWTDPQLESSINRYRQESAISYTSSRDAGMSARFPDKLIYNKITYILDKVTQNYLKAVSPEFLFISGDPNLRHSPYRIGEFYRIELITIILGLLFLAIKARKGDKNSIFLLFWLILAPVPAIITREGGTHASRLFLLFPALTMVSAAGFFYILELVSGKIGRYLLTGIVLLWVFGAAFYLNYYFGAYKLESAKYFQYGFPEAVKQALNRKDGYKYVIIDDREDSALMNYLFESEYDPSDFQARIADMPFEFGKFKAERLDNVYFMKPGFRDWYQAFKDNLINDDYLLIASAVQLEEQTIEKLPGRLTKNQKVLEVIYYKTGVPAFYIIESKQSFSANKKPNSGI